MFDQMKIIVDELQKLIPLPKKDIVLCLNCDDEAYTEATVECLWCNEKMCEMCKENTHVENCEGEPEFKESEEE